MDPVTTLLMIGFLAACSHADNQSKEESAQRDRDANTADRGWGSFDPDDYGRSSSYDEYDCYYGGEDVDDGGF